jgi:hypothetical protein
VCRSNGGEVPVITELRIVNMYSVNNTMNPFGGSFDRFDLRSNHILFDIISECRSTIWFTTLGPHSCA